MNRTIEAILRLRGVADTGAMASKVGKDLDSISRRAKAFNRQQGLFAASLRESYALIARYAAPAALAYTAQKAVKEFASVERQMNRIGITAEASIDQTNDAFGKLQQMAKEVAMPVDAAIAGLDTLVSSGMNLKEAMDFMPSVLATAQASGAATEDIANTALKAASALQLKAADMQHAFDIMVAGGKAGQFELKDMAMYIPDLANSFASLGYKGEDGLKKLVAVLQTIREDTGSASAAATNAQNIFGKMYSQETANKFADFGIDLRKEMEAAKKSGEDALDAFVRISKEAIKGDLTKLPLLFTDQQFRLGMQSLMTSADSYEKFLKVVNDTRINGVVFKDLQRVTSDTQSSIDRLSGSWDKLLNSLGKGLSRPAVPVMNSVSNDLDYGDAVRASLGKRGMSYWQTETWMLKNMPFGAFSKSYETDKLAYQGGLRNQDFLDGYWAEHYAGKHGKTSVGRQNRRVVLPEFPGSSGGGTPVPTSRPSPYPAMPPRLDGVPPQLRTGPTIASMGQDSGGFFRMPSKQEWQDALKIDVSGVKESGAEAGKQVADGGREAGKHIEDSAAFFKVAGYDVGAAIENAAEKLVAAARSFNAVQVQSVTGQAPRRGVNANTGRSMPPVSNGSGPF